jgi:TPR repeat protein
LGTELLLTIPFLQNLDTKSPDLLLLIGYCYFCGVGTEENLENAVHYYTLSARYGNSEAQWRLGACYQYGCGTPQNSLKAFHWYSKSCNQNDLKGKVYLAKLFLKGCGCSRNEKKGFSLLLSAAEAGCFDAFFDLAERYYDGSADRPPNRGMARFWLLKALNEGDGEAEEALEFWDWKC